MPDLGVRFSSNQSRFFAALQPATLFLSTFLVTVATILGTGILALPVKLSKSGFWPFVITFFICCLAQISLVVFMVELLQKAFAESKSEKDSLELADVRFPDDDSSCSDDTGSNAETLRTSSSVRSLDLDNTFALYDSAPSAHRGKKRERGLKKSTSVGNYFGITKSEKRRPSVEDFVDNDEGIDLDLELKSSFSRRNSGLNLSAMNGTNSVGGEESTPLEKSPSIDVIVTEVIDDDAQLDDVSLDIDNRSGSGQRLDDERDIPSRTSTQTPYARDARATLLSDGPDLHSMSNLFLPKYLRLLFEISVVGHFLSILISYGLAGPKAIAQIFGLGNYFQAVIPLFIIVLGLIVVFGSRLIHVLISWATLFKGMLLITMVVVVGIISGNIGLTPTDNWQFVGRPFLISTIALGGTCNTIPVIFSSLVRRGAPSKLSIHIFRSGAVLGVLVCFLINVFWCLFLLRIVPQTGPSPSLEQAEEDGDISTVGLVAVISTTAALQRFKWIGTLVEIFISTSIAVSFITMSSGLKHVLDGYVKSFAKSAESNTRSISRLLMESLRKLTNHPATVVQFSLYTMFFGGIMMMALLNPKSFFVVMEVFASLALNLESGIFIPLMFFISRSFKTPIPSPLPRLFVFIGFIVILYFSFAILYDIVFSGIHVVMFFSNQKGEIPF